jgi:hypothetical protein
MLCMQYIMFSMCVCQLINFKCRNVQFFPQNYLQLKGGCDVAKVLGLELVI